MKNKKVESKTGRLLKFLSPDLVQVWEKKFLPEGQTLKQINEECMAISCCIRKYLYFDELLSPAGVCAGGFALMSAITRLMFPIPSAFTFIPLICVPVIIFLIIYVKAKISSRLTIRCILKLSLDKFEADADGLSPGVALNDSSDVVEGSMTRQHARALLRSRMANLLVSESCFDNLRLQDVRLPRDLIFAGGALLKCQSDYEANWASAVKFEVVTSEEKNELFIKVQEGLPAIKKA